MVASSRVCVDKDVHSSQVTNSHDFTLDEGCVIVLKFPVHCVVCDQRRNIASF